MRRFLRCVTSFWCSRGKCRGRRSMTPTEPFLVCCPSCSIVTNLGQGVPDRAACDGAGVASPARRPTLDPTHRRNAGRPPTARELRQLVLGLDSENPTRGYRRIQDELHQVGPKIAASPGWRILRDTGLDPSPARTVPSWSGVHPFSLRFGRTPPFLPTEIRHPARLSSVWMICSGW